MKAGVSYMAIFRFIAKTFLSIIGYILIFLGYFIGLVAKLGGILLYVLATLFLIAALIFTFSNDFTTQNKLMMWAAAFAFSLLSMFISVLPGLMTGFGSYLVELL
jgi:hypothetical protein